MRESLSPDGDIYIHADVDTPFKGNTVLKLTQAEANGIRAFLRELKPGYLFFKCASCDKFRYLGPLAAVPENGICQWCYHA